MTTEAKRETGHPYRDGERMPNGFRWCSFCQMGHSASSCFHPGRAVVAEIEARYGELVEAAEAVAGLEVVQPRDGRLASSLARLRTALQGVRKTE